jgi:hypothetical protein
MNILTIGPLGRKPFAELRMNDITEPLYDEGESFRPSVPPKAALSSVLSQLKDEFHHLQLYFVQCVVLILGNIEISPPSRKDSILVVEKGSERQ